jgi:hypothetical protein
VTLHLFRLDRDRYAKHATGVPGVPLVLAGPVSTPLDPAVLLPAG